MLRYFFFLTICVIAFQPSLCSTEHIANSPSEFPTHPTTLNHITTVEFPFFIGITIPSWPGLAAFSGSPTSTPNFTKEEIQGLFCIGSVSSLVVAHIECLKAFICSSRHGTELASFCRESPQNASYEITIKLRTQSCSLKPDASINYRDTILSETRILHSKNSTELIHEAATFVEAWIEQNQKNNERTAVDLTPCITTKRGKSIILKPVSLIWNKRHGIERNLREFFLISGTKTHTDRAFSALIFSLTCSAIGISFDTLSRISATK